MSSSSSPGRMKATNEKSSSGGQYPLNAPMVRSSRVGGVGAKAPPVEPPAVLGLAGVEPSDAGQHADGDEQEQLEVGQTHDVRCCEGEQRYGIADARAWDRLHPRLTRRGAWLHEGDLPVLEGTLIRLAVDHLPGDRDPKPLWLWSSRTGPLPSHVDWTGCGRRSCAASTWNARSDCSNRPSAGPPRSSAIRRPRTGGRNC
jgi:hypothetical protein